MGLDIEGATPFCRAAFAQDLEAMKALAAAGADPNVCAVPRHTGVLLRMDENEWLPEEDAEAAGLMMVAPADALRALAPAFKRLEPVMEQLFWSSRFRR